MASLNFNFNPFNDDNWFKKPINLVSLFENLNPFKPQASTPNFAALSFKPSPKKPKNEAANPGKYEQMLDQFYWECENLPDYRHTPEVERLLNEDPVFEKLENPTPEELAENAKRWEEFRASPVVQFLARAEEIANKINELELKENSTPYRKEDRKLWKVCC